MCSVQLLLAWLLVGTVVTFGYNASHLMVDFPKPHSKNNRVLAMMLSYNLNHFDPFILNLNEYLTMCEAGWNVSAVIFTTHQWSSYLVRYMQRKTYCYRTGAFLDIDLAIYESHVGVALGAEHRKYMANRTELFDVFVYHEDDIIFKHTHLMAYLYEIEKLHNLLPENGLHDYLIGFQRYRRLTFASGWGEVDIFEQELLEEIPNFRPVCIKDEPYFQVEGNIHQAMWVLTQQQVKLLHEKCSFLHHNSPSREYMSSFSLYDKKYYHCGLNKIIPGEHFSTFTVWHYYQQRHVSWISAFHAENNLMAGFHFSSNPRVRNDIPSCWTQIVNQSMIELNITWPEPKKDNRRKRSLIRTSNPLSSTSNTSETSTWFSTIFSSCSLFMSWIDKSFSSLFQNLLRLFSFAK